MSDKGGDSSDSASSQTPAQWAAAQPNTSISAWKEKDILSFSVAQLRALTTAQVSQITVPWAIPGAAWTADTLNAVPVQYWGAFGPRYLSTTTNGTVTLKTLSQYDGVSSGVASGISNWFGDLGYSYQSSTGSWVFSPSVIAGISNDRIAAIGSGLGTASHAPTLGANNTVVDAHAFESALNAATSSGERMTTWNISVSSSDQSAGISKRSVVMFGAGWADMGAVFMSALTSSQLGAIAHPEAVLTAVQFGAFSANQLIALRQMDWSRVTAAQLNAISLEAFSGLQTNIIAAISASAWGGLDQAHTQKLNATDISLLSASSIAALKYLGYALTASVAGVLAASQVAGISDSCWAQLSDTNFLNALPLTVMQSIAPSAFARMSSAVIASMDSLHLGALTNAQSLVFPVNELSNASALFYRNPNTLNFSDFVNNPNVNWSQAPASFIRLLTLAQLKLLQPSQIGRLSLAAIAGFTRSQTQALTLAQIQAWRPAQLSAALYMSRRVDVVADIFTVSTVTQISPAFWGRVDSNFLNALSLDAFRALTTAQIEAISTDAFAGIDQAHFEAFTITQLLALTAGQVGSFRGEYLSIFFLRNIRLVSFKGLVPEQMHRLHDYLFNTVATNAFATADPELLETAEHQFATLLASILESDDGREAWLQQSVNLLIRLNWLDPAAASTLSASDVQSIYSALNWAWMSGTFLNSIMVSVFAQIRASSIAQLNLSALAALDDAHVQALTVTQAAGLSGEQLSAIANLGALQANVVRSLTASQLVGITTDWSTISATFLNNMQPWQFAALTPSQFGQLTTAQLNDPQNNIAWSLLSAADWNALSLETFAQLCTGASAPILQASSEALLGLSGEQMAALAQASRFYNEAQRRQLLSGLFGSFTGDQSKNLLNLLNLDTMDQIVLQVGLVNVMAKVDGTTFGVDNAIAALAMLRQTQANATDADNLALMLKALSAQSEQYILKTAANQFALDNPWGKAGLISALFKYNYSSTVSLYKPISELVQTVKQTFQPSSELNAVRYVSGAGNASEFVGGIRIAFNRLYTDYFVPNATPEVRLQVSLQLQQLRDKLIANVTSDLAPSGTGEQQRPAIISLRDLQDGNQIANYLAAKVNQAADDYLTEAITPALAKNAKLAAIGSAATSGLALLGFVTGIGASINAFGAAAYAAVDKQLSAKERRDLVASSVLGGLAYAAQGLQLPVTLIMQAIVQRATGQKYVDNPNYLDAVWQKFTEGFTSLRNAGAAQAIRERIAAANALPDIETPRFFIEDPIQPPPVVLATGTTIKPNGTASGYLRLLATSSFGIDKTVQATFNADGTLNSVTDLVGTKLQPSAESIRILEIVVQKANAEALAKGQPYIETVLVGVDSGDGFGAYGAALDRQLSTIAASAEEPLTANIHLVKNNVQRFIYNAVEKGYISGDLDAAGMIRAAQQLLVARGVSISTSVKEDVTSVVIQIKAGVQPNFEVQANVLKVLSVKQNIDVIFSGDFERVLTELQDQFEFAQQHGYQGDENTFRHDVADIAFNHAIKALDEKFQAGGYDDLLYTNQVSEIRDSQVVLKALAADLDVMGIDINIVQDATKVSRFQDFANEVQASFLVEKSRYPISLLVEKSGASLYNDARVLGLQDNPIITQALASRASAEFDNLVGDGIGIQETVLSKRTGEVRLVATGGRKRTALGVYDFVTQTTFGKTAPSSLQDRAFSQTLTEALLDIVPSGKRATATPEQLLTELYNLRESSKLASTLKKTFAAKDVLLVGDRDAGTLAVDRVLVFDEDILTGALLSHLQKVNPSQYGQQTVQDIATALQGKPIFSDTGAGGGTIISSQLGGRFNDAAYLATNGVAPESIYSVAPVLRGDGSIATPGVLKPEISNIVQTSLRAQLNKIVNRAVEARTTLDDRGYTNKEFGSRIDDGAVRESISAFIDKQTGVDHYQFKPGDYSYVDESVDPISKSWRGVWEGVQHTGVGHKVADAGTEFNTSELYNADGVDEVTREFVLKSDSESLNIEGVIDVAQEKLRSWYVKQTLADLATRSEITSNETRVELAHAVIKELGGDPANYSQLIADAFAENAPPPLQARPAPARADAPRVSDIALAATIEVPTLQRAITPLTNDPIGNALFGSIKKNILAVLKARLNSNEYETYVDSTGTTRTRALVRFPRNGFAEASPEDINAKLTFLLQTAEPLIKPEALASKAGAIINERLGASSTRAQIADEFSIAATMFNDQLISTLDSIIYDTPSGQGISDKFKVAYSEAGGARGLLAERIGVLTEPTQAGLLAAFRSDSVQQAIAKFNVSVADVAAADTFVANVAGDARVQTLLANDFAAGEGAGFAYRAPTLQEQQANVAPTFTRAAPATADIPVLRVMNAVASPEQIGADFVGRMVKLARANTAPGEDFYATLNEIIVSDIYSVPVAVEVQARANKYGIGRIEGETNIDFNVGQESLRQAIAEQFPPTKRPPLPNEFVNNNIIRAVQTTLGAQVSALPLVQTADVMQGKAFNSKFLNALVDKVATTYNVRTPQELANVLSHLHEENGTPLTDFIAQYAVDNGLAGGVAGDRPNYLFSIKSEDVVQAIATKTGAPLEDVKAIVNEAESPTLFADIATTLNTKVFQNLPLSETAVATVPDLNSVVVAVSTGASATAAYSPRNVIHEYYSRGLAKVFTDVLASSIPKDGVVTESPEALLVKWLGALTSEFAGDGSPGDLASGFSPKETETLRGALQEQVSAFMEANQIGRAPNGKLNVGLKVDGIMVRAAIAQSIQEVVASNPQAFSDPRFAQIQRANDVQTLVVKIKQSPQDFFGSEVVPEWFASISVGLDAAASHINVQTYSKLTVPELSVVRQSGLAKILLEYQIEVAGSAGLPVVGPRRQQLLNDLVATVGGRRVPRALSSKLSTFFQHNKLFVSTDANGGKTLDIDLKISGEVLTDQLIKVLQEKGALSPEEQQALAALVPDEVTGKPSFIEQLRILGVVQGTAEGVVQVNDPVNQPILEAINHIGSSVPDVALGYAHRVDVPAVTVNAVVKSTSVPETLPATQARAEKVGQSFLDNLVLKLNVQRVTTARNPYQSPLRQAPSSPETILAELKSVLSSPDGDNSLQVVRNLLDQYAAHPDVELGTNAQGVLTADGGETVLQFSTDMLAKAVVKVLAEDRNTVVTLDAVRQQPELEAATALLLPKLKSLSPPIKTTAAPPPPVQPEVAAPLGAAETVVQQVRVTADTGGLARQVGAQGVELQIAEPAPPEEGRENILPNREGNQPVEIVQLETPKAKFTRLGLAGQGFAQLGFALFASIVGIAAGIAGIVYAAQSKTLSSSARALTITMNVVRIFSSVTILVGSGAQIASSIIKVVSIAEDVANIANVAFGIGNVVGIATSAAQFLMQIKDISNTTATGRSLLIQRLAIVDTTIQLLLAIAGTLALVGGPIGIAISIIVLLVASLIPSTAAIASAITYHESYTNLKGQGLYNEAQVMFVYYQSAALDATPIVNWTSSIYTPEIKKAQEKLMDQAWMDQSAQQRVFYSITGNSAFKANFDGVRDQTYAAAVSLTQPLVNLSQGLTRAVTLMLSQDNLSYFEGDKVATVKLAATSNYATNTVVRAPKLISATVNGTNVTLTFNQNLASLTSQLPDLSTFSVQVNGVAATLHGFALSGNGVILTLATAVTAGQVVTFSYSDPTAGDDQHALQAITGKDLAGITSHAVVNLLDTDTRAPKLVDAVVQDRYLTLVFDEVLNSATDHVPSASEFSVSVGGVNAPILGINVGDYRVLLTLVNSVASGDTVSVSYTPAASSGSKLLQDAAGNQVAAFTSGSAGAVSVENTTAVSTITASRVGWLQHDNFVSSIQGTGTEDASVLNGSDYTVYASDSAASSGTARLRYLSLSNAVGEFDMYAASRTSTTNDSIWLDASSALGTASFSVNVNDMTVWGGQGYNSYSLLRDYANSNIIVAANSWSANNNIVSIAGSSSDSNKTVNLDNLLTADNISAGLASGQTPFKVLGSRDGLDVVVGTADSQSYFATTNVANINLSGANANVLMGESSQVKVGVNGRVQVDMDMWRSLNLPAPVIPSSGTTGVVTGNYGSYSLLNFAATDSINPSFEGSLSMSYQIGHLPALSAWKVNVGGTLVNVSSMSVRGNKVTLNLAKAVQQNQTVSVSYSDLSMGNDLETLQDLVGNDVASFTPQSVVNVTADTTPPVLVVATVQGSSLIVHFSEALNQAYSPLTTAFSVLIGNTPVPVNKVVFNDSSSLRLTLDEAVTAGQTVSVSYATPSLAALGAQDLAGNALNIFSGASVVNLANVTQAPNLRALIVNGNTLLLTFDGTLRYTLSDTSAFVVTANNTPVSISNVTVVGNSVLLYLSSAVSSNQLVEVSYTPPQQVNDATTLRDWLGNLVSGWGAQLATNITGQDVTPPTLQYAIANGNSVVMTFSEALNSQVGFMALANAFIVQVNAQAVLVTQVAVSGATVTLSLASTINYGDAVTLAYTDFSTENDLAVVQDLAGNDAASFSGVNVVNNSPDTTPPTLLSASVTNNLLTLVFSESLNNVTGYLPALTSIAVNVNGALMNIIAGSLNGSVATLTLYNAVNAGDYVTFGYLDPSSANDTQAFQDLAGNDLASIANFGVTNLTGVDLTPPSLVSAQVSGNVLTLTFSEALVSTPNYIPSASAFKIYVNGNLSTVSAVTLNGKQASLTLVTSVDSTQKVSVSYVQPTSQGLQDGAGNLAASFSLQSASNVTADTTAPSVTSVVVAGALLTLTFSENLATSPSLIPNASAFSVKVDGQVADVLSTLAQNNTLTITLARAVNASQTVSVDYTPIANSPNNLQDTLNNKTAKFSQTALNWSGIPSIQNANINASCLTMKFNQTLDGASGHLPPLSAFTVKVNGVTMAVSQLAVNGYNVTLTLEQAVTADQVVTVNYTDPSSGNDVLALQNLAGMDVQTFSAPYAVHNLTAAVVDYTPPSLSSAVVNGSALTLTFSEALDAGVGEWLVNYLPNNRYDDNGKPLVTSSLLATGFVNVLGSNGNDTIVINDQSGLATAQQLGYVQLGNGQGVQVNNYDTSGNLLLALGSAGQANVILESGSSLQKLFTNKLVQSPADVANFKANRDTVTLKSLSSLTTFLSGYEIIDATESTSSLTAEIGGGDHQIKLGGQTVNLQFDKVASNTSITTKQIQNSWLDYQYFNFNGIDANGLWVGRESDGTVLFQAQWTNDSGTDDILSVSYDGTVSNVVLEVGNVLATANSSQLRLDKLIEVMTSPAFSSDPNAVSHAMAVTDPNNGSTQARLYRITDIVAYSASQATFSGGV